LEEHEVFVRLSQFVPQTSAIFGLAVGDAMVLRNAGNRISYDVLRSLLLAVYELGVTRILLCGHTGCGTVLEQKKALEVLQKVSDQSHIPVDQLVHELGGLDSWNALGAIEDVYENVRKGLEILRQSNLFPQSIQFCGAVYQVETGETEFIDG
jgi:carbonic anhydrase